MIREEGIIGLARIALLERSSMIKKEDSKKEGLSSHGLPKRSPTLVLPVPEAA